MGSDCRQRENSQDRNGVTLNQLIESLAQDFSGEVADCYRISAPAAGYYDALVEVLGSDPSKNEAISVLKERIPDLAKELSWCFERKFSRRFVRQMYHRALINYYGDTLD